MLSSPTSMNNKNSDSSSHSKHVDVDLYGTKLPKKQPPKQVSFLSVATIYIVENYKLTLAKPKARAKVWYTAMELYTFRKEVLNCAFCADTKQEQQQLTAEAGAILQQRFGAPQQKNQHCTCMRLRIDRRIPAREAYALRRQQQPKQQQCTPKKQQQQQQQQQQRLYHQHQHPMYHCHEYSKKNKTNKTKTSSTSSSLRSSRSRFSGNRRGRTAWPTITTRRS